MNRKVNSVSVVCRIQSTRGNERGHLILEATLVIALWAILAAASVPSLQDFRRSLEIRWSARQMVRAIESASVQSRALERDIVLVIASGEWSMLDALRPEPVIMTRKFPVGVTLQSEDEQRVTARSSGTISPATIKLLGGDRRCTITVGLRGRITLRCD